MDLFNDRVLLDLASKATADAMSAIRRTIDLADNVDHWAAIYLYVAGAVIAAAGGTFAAAQDIDKEEATEAVLSLLHDLMTDNTGVFDRIKAMAEA